MAIKVTPADMTLLERQSAPWLSSASSLPISFFLGDRRVRGIPSDFSPDEKTVKSGNGVTDRIFTGIDSATGLEVKTTVTVYSDFPVLDIVTVFTNKGKTNTPMLRELQGFDGSFYGKMPYLYSSTGDYCSYNSYETTRDLYDNQMWRRFSPQAGRPCDHCFPYFRIRFGENTGINLAIGWPAQWSAEFSQILAGIQMKAGQECTSLYLCPGESVRTPKITIMAYDGDTDRGVNLWRRWYMAHILPRPNGKPLSPQLSTSYNGGGVEFTDATEENQLKYIAVRAASGIPYTNWWIDAGWYECTAPDGSRDWTITGTWRADSRRFPRGLKPVSDEAKRHGMKLLLWFEPERVRENTDFYKEHPEWMLKVDTEPDGNWGISENRLLNIGIPACCDYLIEHIDKLIKEYGIGVYRQDFNFPPLRFWRENEAFDRKGFIENMYVQGYLRFWDTLLERNPGLWIDSCASGGRRNDLETLRRSVPLHPTDFGYGFHPYQQTFSRTLYSWIPYLKIATASWDDPAGFYPARTDEHNNYNKMPHRESDFFSKVSSFSPFFACGFKDKPDADDLAMLKIWQRAAQLMLDGDYYPLTETTKRDDSFFINEYNSSETGRGFIQALRNIGCSEESCTVKLKDLEPEKTYLLENLRTGETLTRTGKELAEGFTVTLARRDAAIWLYSAK